MSTATIDDVYAEGLAWHRAAMVLAGALSVHGEDEYRGVVL